VREKPLSGLTRSAGGRREYARANDRELNGKTPDGVAWCADLSWWYFAQKQQGTLDPKYEGDEGYLRLHRETGTGIYLYAPQVWKESPDATVRTAAARDGNLTRTVISTPAGTIAGVTEYVPTPTPRPTGSTT